MSFVEKCWNFEMLSRLIQLFNELLDLVYIKFVYIILQFSYKAIKHDLYDIVIYVDFIMKRALIWWSIIANQLGAKHSSHISPLVFRSRFLKAR